MGPNLFSNYFQAVAIILFGIGFTTLFLNRNLIKKVIGLNIMDSAVFLFLASCGYIDGGMVPIIVDGITDMDYYINPIPAGLVLTGIVVSVSITAVSLSLIQRLYKAYHTLDLDEILMRANREV